MTADDKEELKLLAAMAYAEASSKNVYKEMAAIASVLVRQRDARGYATMEAFVNAEPSYSFVVTDGNPRFAELRSVDVDAVDAQLESANSEVADAESLLNEAKEAMVVATEKEKVAQQNGKKAAQREKTIAQKQVNAADSRVKEKRFAQKKLYGYQAAIRAAENALKGGEDFSGGAYFWDGFDIKTNYSRHFKVRHGVKVMDQSHNVVGIGDSTKLVILTKTVTKKTTTGKKKSTETVEIGRYDHVYESTAGHGGTIFWKHNSDYMRVTRAKEYK